MNDTMTTSYCIFLIPHFLLSVLVRMCYSESLLVISEASVTGELMLTGSLVTTPWFSIFVTFFVINVNDHKGL
jgi:hypothetical protein